MLREQTLRLPEENMLYSCFSWTLVMRLMIKRQAIDERSLSQQNPAQLQQDQARLIYLSYDLSLLKFSLNIKCAKLG